MRICIVGGALQGMEAVFLGRKAGYETVLIDRRPDAPALSICDEPHVLNPVNDPEGALAIFRTCDAVLPACEEHDLLEVLDRILAGSGIPFLFDLRAYDTSQSKLLSNDLMQEVGVPLPGHWPECGFPVVVKPSSQSGSIGVSVAHSQEEIDAGLEKVRSLGDDPVIQEFVHGKSVSLEVIGDGSKAFSYVTTEVVLDGGYDCKEVRCFPDILDDEQQESFGKWSRLTAERLGLNALMDVEAILTPKGLRFLEIDARIPSQTPAAILTATGVNLLERLVESRLGEHTEAVPSGRSGIYWHLHFKDGVLETTGEKEFSHVRGPRLDSGLFGSDDSISDYAGGRAEWHGTFMVSGDTPAEAESRRLSVIQAIMGECGCEKFVDLSPKEA
ncbi:MAG: 3-methylornithine--L-lysine ligase PylC [Thermoplasmata archaeon]|nr:3-methylornithine--L-lysine ligase PylC [Thermoplasmata archaeon]